MTSYILLVWTMITYQVTETEHGQWHYLGTYESAELCEQTWSELSKVEFKVYGKFRCMQAAYPAAEPIIKPAVRF